MTTNPSSNSTSQRKILLRPDLSYRMFGIEQCPRKTVTSSIGFSCDLSHKPFVFNHSEETKFWYASCYFPRPYGYRTSRSLAQEEAPHGGVWGHLCDGGD